MSTGREGRGPEVCRTTATVYEVEGRVSGVREEGTEEMREGKERLRKERGGGEREKRGNAEERVNKLGYCRRHFSSSYVKHSRQVLYPKLLVFLHTRSSSLCMKCTQHTGHGEGRCTGKELTAFTAAQCLSSNWYSYLQQSDVLLEGNVLSMTLCTSPVKSK